MKTRRAVELREVEYWTCHYADHRHTTPEIAGKCIEKYETLDHSPRRRWTDEMMAECKAKHDGGMTYSAIGKELGIHGSRVSQVLRKWDRILRRRSYVEDAARSISDGIKSGN